jgi:hypothetical protein
VGSNILSGPTDRISLAMNPTILLLYWIHLIFQILVRPRQELECWPMARKWKATSAFRVDDSLISYILSICKNWLGAQNISEQFSCFTKKIKVFHSNKFTTSFTSQLAFFWFFRNRNHQIKVSSLATQSNYNSQTQELKYTETRQNKNYDYDFTSSNANSYEVWTKRRHEIKHKPKL